MHAAPDRPEPEPPADEVSAPERIHRDGLDLFARNDFPAAIARLEEALAIDPAHVPSLRTIAMACYRAGDYPRALEYGRRHLDADPKDVMAWSGLSLFLMKNGRIKEAEDAAAKAKVLTWKKQIREGDGPKGLDVLEKPAVVESAPIMPMMPLMPPLAPRPSLAKPPPPATPSPSDPPPRD